MQSFNLGALFAYIPHTVYDHAAVTLLLTSQEQQLSAVNKYALPFVQTRRSFCSLCC